MRKIFLFMMVSLDGYFEAPGHDLSWHNAANEEFAQFVHEQNNHLDTILFGRRTYDLMASYWPSSEGEDDKETADWMSKARKVVVTHHAFEPTWEHTEVMHENVVNAIAKLKEEPGTDIALLGSNMLCVSLMEAGLVDEFRIMVNPVAIGKGTPLFAGISRPFKVKLLDSRTFTSGNVLNRYVPLP